MLERAYRHIKTMIVAVEIFKALGDETRLRLINLFLQTEGNLCVCEMVFALELPQYQISKHLTILKNADMLLSNRAGTWVYYHLDREKSPFLRDLFNILGQQLGEIFTADVERLRQRLELRKDDKCVVGFIPKEELKELIKVSCRSHRAP